MLIYTAAYKPFKERKEDIRACFNYLVIIMTLSLRVYFQVSHKSNYNTKGTYTYLFFLLGLMIATAVVAVAFIIYQIVDQHCFKNNQKKTNK
jgi:hypothetical protein